MQFRGRLWTQWLRSPIGSAYVKYPVPVPNACFLLSWILGISKNGSRNQSPNTHTWEAWIELLAHSFSHSRGSFTGIWGMIWQMKALDHPASPNAVMSIQMLTHEFTGFVADSVIFAESCEGHREIYVASPCSNSVNTVNSSTCFCMTMWLPCELCDRHVKGSAFCVGYTCWTAEFLHTHTHTCATHLCHMTVLVEILNSKNSIWLWQALCIV